MDSLISIARKAGYLEAGDEAVGSAVRARRAKLIMVASDSAANTFSRALNLSRKWGVPMIKLPQDKFETGAAIGRGSCALLALTDKGLAVSLLKKLPGEDCQRALLSLTTKTKKRAKGEQGGCII